MYKKLIPVWKGLIPTQNAVQQLFVYSLIVKSSLTLCDLRDCSPPDSSVHGISWYSQEYGSGLSSPIAVDLPDSGIEPASPVLTSGFFTTESSDMSNSMNWQGSFPD